MLDRIRLQNFKTHRDTEIELGRLTVLVGPNGAGKSSVLQAIRMLRGLLHNPAEYRLSPLKFMTTLPQNGASVEACALHIAGTFVDGAPWSRAFGAQPLSTNRMQVRTAPGAPTSERPIEPELVAILLTPNPSRLAAPVPATFVTPVMASDGEGLADVLAKMQLEDTDSFQALQAALRAVVPQVQRVGVRRVQIAKKTPVIESTAKGPQIGSRDEAQLAHELTFDVSGRRGIPADMMSGGTLLVLGILALLYSPARPRILLLDDIDHGLHPRAQWDLLRQLRRLLEQFPDLQIVATSHSPDLVDELDPKEVVVMALRDDGTSAAKPLTACPREDMLGVLRAGQLWSAVGEDWVKAADPEPTPTEPTP